MRFEARMTCVALLAAAGMAAAQELPPAQPQQQQPPAATSQDLPSPQDLNSPQVQAQIAAHLQTQAASQNAPDANQHPADPTLKQNPLTVLRNFEPPPDTEYRLGRGDAITVDFSGHPEMQAKLVVGPDGRISLPMAGEVMVADLTREEAASAVVQAMSQYYTNMTAQVTVTQYTSNRVLLLGAVEKPGVLIFDGTPTLLEAITRGGILQGGTTQQGQLPEQCAIYRGNDQVVWVDLRELLHSGNSLANLRLRRDDVVYVPSALERFVSVLGEVQHPGAVPLTHASTLASVIAEAGGITDHAGNDPHIQIVDTATGTSRVLNYKDLMNPVKSLEITLKPGDIVYIPKSGFYKASYYLERLSPLVTVASMAFYAGAL
jgi:polysaccharide export outer membrane protein